MSKTKVKLNATIEPATMKLLQKESEKENRSTSQMADILINEALKTRGKK